MALKRPNRLKYAIYTKEGKEKYAKDMRAYKKAQADAAKKKPAPKKPVAKKPVAKKPVAKKPATKKPAAKKPVAKKPVAKKPATTKTTTRPKRTANNLKIKKAANTAAKTTKQVIKKATPVVKKAASTVRKKAGEAKQAVDKKVSGVKKAFRKKAPKPTTPAQKAVSKVYQGSKNLIKKGLPKAKKAIGSNLRSSVKGGVAGVASTALTDAINTRTERVIAKNKGMTLEEFRAFKKDPKNQRGIVSLSKKLVNKVRGKSNTQTSTTKNINKQKSNNTGLKVKKTERSSKVNTNKDYNAKTAKKQYNPKMATFREDSKANRDLQLEVQKQGKKKNKTVTYSRVLSTQAKNQISNTKKNKDKKTKPESKFIRGKGGRLLRRGSPTAMRAENRERARKRAQEMARKRLRNK